MVMLQDIWRFVSQNLRIIWLRNHLNISVTERYKYQIFYRNKDRPQYKHNEARGSHLLMEAHLSESLPSDEYCIFFLNFSRCLQSKTPLQILQTKQLVQMFLKSLFLLSRRYDSYFYFGVRRFFQIRVHDKLTPAFT